MSLYLRPLDVVDDANLFRESYNWRPKHRKTQPNPMSLEQFMSNDPSQLTIGLFNGDFLAVYVLQEVEPAKFQVHFTSSRKADPEDVIAGARQVLAFMLENGGKEVWAYIVARNDPVRRFVESVGFEFDSFEEMCCITTQNGDRVSDEQASSLVRYARYVKRTTSP